MHTQAAENATNKDIGALAIYGEGPTRSQDIACNVQISTCVLP